MTPILICSPFGYMHSIHPTFGYAPYYINTIHPIGYSPFAPETSRTGYSPFVPAAPSDGYISPAHSTSHHSLNYDTFSDILDANDPLIHDTTEADSQFFTSRLSPDMNKCDLQSIQSPGDVLSLSIPQTTTNIKPSESRKLALKSITSTTLNPWHMSQQTLSDYRFILALFLYCIATRPPNQSFNWQMLQNKLSLIQDNVQHLFPDLIKSEMPGGHTIKFHGIEMDLPFPNL